MRLDKFLKVSRLIKRRTVANEACDAGRVSVNGKPAKASVQVKPGDVIEIKEKHKGAQRYKDILEVTDGRLVPDWLEADHEKLSGVVKEIPTREQIDVPVNEVLIVELYSK